MPISLDTNILMRNPCHLSSVAIGEMGHWLRPVYRASAADLTGACRALIDFSNVDCENEDRLPKAGT